MRRQEKTTGQWTSFDVSVISCSY